MAMYCDYTTGVKWPEKVWYAVKQNNQPTNKKQQFLLYLKQEETFIIYLFWGHLQGHVWMWPCPL